MNPNDFNPPEPPTAGSARREAVQTLPRPNLPAPYESSQKVLFTKSFAYDYFSNPRHLESLLHPLYGQIFAELTQPYANLIPCVQYTLWLTCKNGVFEASQGHGHVDYHGPEEENLSEDDESVDLEIESESESEDTVDSSSEDEEGGKAIFEPTDAEHIDGHEMNSVGNSGGPAEKSLEEAADEIEDEENFHDGQGEISFTSMVTEANPKGWERLPDLAIIHSRFLRLKPLPDDLLNSDRSPEVFRYAHRHGVRPHHGCCSVLGELKHGPSRRLDSDPAKLPRFRSALRKQLEAAKWDLLVYAAWFFTQQPSIEEIVVFAAAGIYWQWKVVRKEDVPGLEFGEKPKEWLKRDLRKARAAFGFGFSQAYEVGTAASDRAFTRLRNEYLHDLGCDGSAI